ncbi:hypothetical protein KL930_003024 [Ogataea haglerorum]|nr:hypothetical protein KL915_003684 [Ogataea haglerorum]KAG7704725.1 hypothetical protein KL914_004116 [Ogataea haglerorum]KAG7704836.1 hypothetical protein KL950_004009 [Ogataea haglerorum]KAG7731353.1 hypothetical protein KL948_002983 [Ogataea haglerorum]KAG7738367.1 hypothetical protein KL923_003064 [Ogataea haglerorum]
MVESQASVGVIGAGLVGALVALGLAKQGYTVTLYDRRSDPRTAQETSLRSINLAVSERGIRALRYVDKEMAERVLEGIIPMHGRMIHDLDGNQESQLYGLFGEAINSIDRKKLNQNLIEEIERFNATAKFKIELIFEAKVTSVQVNGGVTINYVHAGEPRRDHRDFVVGADGTYSVVRQSLQKLIRMNYSQEYIDMCYLEMYIPPGPDGSFRIDPNRLHIWPRKTFMLIALANQDGSFTSTFFGPWKLVESLDSPKTIEFFFKKNFKDAIPLIGLDKIIECFTTYPRGALMQLNCSKYNFEDKCIIIGDAAHSMVPFYGQGMNCGFEDVRILLELLEKHRHDRHTAFDAYSESRAEDLKAILKLALRNYHEMSSDVTSSIYLFRKKLDGVLGRLMPQHWIPLYTMVSFRSDISYADAVRFSQKQEQILKWAEWGAVGSILAGTALYLARRSK